VPSGEQSGIKLHFEFTVEAGQETPLLLDVDLSRAFTAIPSGHIDETSTIEGFHFHPSYGMRLINLLEAGTITGKVTDTNNAAVPGAAVTAYNGTEEVTTTSTGDDGTYTLMGLLAGTYRVEFSAKGYETAEVQDASVTIGQTTPDINAVLQETTTP